MAQEELALTEQLLDLKGDRLIEQLRLTCNKPGDQRSTADVTVLLNYVRARGQRSQRTQYHQAQVRCGLDLEKVWSWARLFPSWALS